MITDQHQPHIVVASGPGAFVIALTGSDPALDLVRRMAPDFDNIAYRPLRPGEAQMLQRTISIFVR